MTTNLNKFIINYLIEFLLALVIVVGTVDNTRNLILFGNTDSFWFGSILLLLIVLVYMWFWFRHRSKRLELNLIFNDEVNEFGVVVNKILVPIFLYISLIYYAYYNITSGMLGIIYAIQFFAFYIYFVNVKAFFKRELNREHRTDVVYDIFKFLIFFLSIDVIANLTRDFSLSKEFATILVGTLSFVLISMVLMRLSKIQKQYLLSALALSLIISVVFFGLLSFSGLNFVILSFLMLLLFYSLVALMFHKIYGTLNKNLVFEYAAVIALCFSVLLFL